MVDFFVDNKTTESVIRRRSSRTATINEYFSSIAKLMPQGSFYAISYIRSRENPADSLSAVS